MKLNLYCCLFGSNNETYPDDRKQAKISDDKKFNNQPIGKRKLDTKNELTIDDVKSLSEKTTTDTDFLRKTM